MKLDEDPRGRLEPKSAKPTIHVTRRNMLSTLAVGGTALAAFSAKGVKLASARTALAANASHKSPGTSVAFAGNHTVVALPFATVSLNGLSERMMVSHHDNNYAGAVRNLNRVEQDLSAITKDTPAFMVAALRDRELTFRNSKTLHENYFGNLGGNGRCSGAVEGALGRAYGSLARWEEHFRVTGLGLGGGSGWVILNYELDTGALRTTASGNHTQMLAFGMPLLVMDMYEHAYQMDFGAGVAHYIDAFFANVKWEEVNRRFERAQRASSTLGIKSG